MRIFLEGGHPLQGEVEIGGAKNAALPILAATLLTDDECLLENVPCIEDVRTMIRVLEQLGVEIRVEGPHSISVRAEEVSSDTVPPDLATRMRGSFLVVGPLLSRFGRVTTPHPGGCAIGTRPVSVDLKGFETMGASVSRLDGNYIFSVRRLRGERLSLDYPSHTGTENLLMAACLADGSTVIENASVEPEVVDLANFLRAMGARIYGAGTGTIHVEGVPKLHGVVYRVMADRLEAGTFAIGAAITHGQVTLRGRVSQYLGALTSKLIEAGAEVEAAKDCYTISVPQDLKPVDIQTFPYPGFPTDLQAPFGALMTQANGISSIHETMYDDRLLYVGELRKMGAQITVAGQTAIIQGPTPLRGAEVRALDIRSGAAVILAGLAAEGTTTVSDIFYVDRGYEDIDGKLRCLGARVWREGCPASPAQQED